MDKENVIHISIHIYRCVPIYLSIYPHGMEYYSAIKKNEIIAFAATWMNLEIITLAK